MKLKTIEKTIILIIGGFLFASAGLAQNSDLSLDKGVKAHAEIDAIYKKFSEGYRTLKPEIVANLYAEDAAYLQPNADVMTGRSAILQNFTEFFDGVKDGGRNLTVSFQILQRKVEKKIGYDVGIYTVTSYKDGKKLGESKGKFVVVAVKDAKGEWRFQADGFSSLKPPPKN